MELSKPTLEKFDPRVIPYQYKVIQGVRKEYDYSIGCHEILLSGALGSSKTTLLAHLAASHCAMFPGARVLIGRRALPDLKSTIYSKIIEHISETYKEGVDFTTNTTTAYIRFSNGSEIIARSWADAHYSKVRSLDLSAAILEELSETDEPEFYNEIKMRVGRVNGIKENFICSATNPGAPSMWIYKYFELGKSDAERCNTKHVYYSVTTDNPFLPPQYVEQLRRDLDPQMARRMIFGEWIEIESEVVYYSYDKTRNRKGPYVVGLNMPIHLSWDFNIGDGKPLSLVAIQRDRERDEFHIFDEVVIDGMRTEESCEEAAGKGILDYRTKYIVNGDASGKHRDTRNIKSDYEIIRAFFSNYRTKDGRQLDFEMQVPLANPPIRKRHNIVNAYCCNDAGQRRLFVYDTAPTADEGLRLTSLKKGGQYIEDDSKGQRFQHISTAIGYCLVETIKRESIPEQGTRRL